MTKYLVAYTTIVCALFITLISPSPLSSANLSSVKDTLQTSRLSWSARVESAGTVVGSSRVQIQAAPTVPYNANSTNNLRAGDSIYINSNSYTVVDVIDSDEFSVSPVVQAGDADNGDPIQLKQKARHVITFNTTSAVADGYFRVLIPADATTPADGNVDDGGFDFGIGTIDVVAPDVSGYDFVTGVATYSGDTNCTSPANYHCFEVHYSGTGSIGTTITINIGNTNGTNSLLNPTETAAHTEGTADTFTYSVQNYSGSNVLIDSSSGQIALVEAVKVTATIDPTISLTVTGIASGQTRCGVSTSVTTTATNVPFGTMALNTFKTLAQQLTVNTNAQSGYVVTASENDQLGKDGGTTPFIPDTTCDGAACTESTAAEWNTATNNGFGYSLQNVDAATIAFSYNDSSRTFNSKQFADQAGAESVQTIFNSTTVANAEDVYVCYRLSIGATQAAGDYENQITYTATGTF